MPRTNWRCLKCSNDNYETDEFRATGGMFTKLFNIQSKRFTTVTCTKCSYTEIYRTDQSAIGNVFDFLFN